MFGGDDLALVQETQDPKPGAQAPGVASSSGSSKEIAGPGVQEGEAEGEAAPAATAAAAAEPPSSTSMAASEIATIPEELP